MIHKAGNQDSGLFHATAGLASATLNQMECWPSGSLGEVGFTGEKPQARDDCLSY